jgi:hypothetical protein
MASLATTPSTTTSSTTTQKTQLKRRDSFSLETAEINRIANLDVSFTENIHVQAPLPSKNDLEAAIILKEAILALDIVKGLEKDLIFLIAPVVEPANLQRILRARKFVQEDALSLAQETVNW